MTLDRVRLKFTSDLPLKYGANAAAEFDNPDWPRFVRITDVTPNGDLRDDTFRSLPPEVAAGYELEEGDILLARSGATVGKSFIYNSSWGRACYAGYLIRSRTASAYWPKFIYWFLQSSEYWAEIQANLIQATIQNFSAEKYANLRVPAPPIEDQMRIAAFLDEKTVQIDGLIAKKQALLDRLAEKRQAIITQAVTKGLSPAAPMKDSRIDWLGQVPAHWQVLSFGRSISRIEQGWSPQCEEREKDEVEWGVLRSGCVNEGVFRPSDHKALPVELDPRPQLEVRGGDLLMCRASGSLHLIGSAAVVDECPPRLMFSDKTYRISLQGDSADAKFIALTLGAKYMREQIVLSVSGAGGLANNIPQSLIKSYILARPPLNEQREIAQTLSADLRRMDNVTRPIEHSVQALYEYRSALITAAVAGSIEGLE